MMMVMMKAVMMAKMMAMMMEVMMTMAMIMSNAMIMMTNYIHHIGLFFATVTKLTHQHNDKMSMNQFYLKAL